jgi:hypothetical protein
MKRASAWLILPSSQRPPAREALDVGDIAPGFSVPAALGGKVACTSIPTRA